MTIENHFFELLQVAIGTRKSLSVTPTSQKWALLFEMAKKQALVGIAFAGVTKLNTSSDYGASLGIDEMTYLKWLGLMAKTAQRNKEMTIASAELCKELAHDGLVSCILKGQGNLEYYPEGLQECRTPGDIDVWCTTLDPSGLDIAIADADGKGAHYEKYHGIEAIIEYSRMRARIAGVQNPEIRYNNTEFHGIWPWDVEIHHRPSMMNNFIHNIRLQRWCRENEQFGVRTYNGFGVPTVSFNAIYQLSHIYTHLLDEGVGLRQLLDYYFVLRALHVEQGELADRTESMAQWAVLRQAQEPEKDTVGEPFHKVRINSSRILGIAVASNKEIMHTLSRFGMKKFAGAVMYVLAQVFDSETKTIKTPDGNVSVAVSENSSELDLSATATSTGSNTASYKPSGKKQEKQFCWQKRWPWMICEPDEKEGKFLLNEIMQAGNFGKYDNRIKHGGSQFSHAIEKTKHNFRLLTHYPEEVLCEPFFRLYHYLWRRFSLWRY